jgi:hypothetical protein
MDRSPTTLKMDVGQGRALPPVISWRINARPNRDRKEADKRK